MGYVLVASTILLTVYGQLAIKWQLGGQELPDGFLEKIGFLMMQLLNPWVFSSFAAAFIAAVCWMAAMTKLPISQAYPFMSLAFVIVILVSGYLFNEPIGVNKIVGAALIVAGLVFISR